MSIVIHEQIAWLVTTMGYGDQLLYWEPIFKRLTEQTPNCQIHLTPGKIISEEGSLNVIEDINIMRFSFKAKKNSKYDRVISFLNPKIIFSVVKRRPELLVLSEFGLLTLYGVLMKLLNPSSKILLLVESDPGEMSHMRIIFRRIFCFFAENILTNNDSGYNYLRNTLKVDSQKIIKAPYLVSQPKSSGSMSATDIKDEYAQQYLSSSEVKFVYVGQLAKRKGIDHLIQAVAKLPKEKQQDLKIAIIGGGSENDLERLHKLTKECDVKDCFMFLGRQPFETLEYFYKNSDVFIFPTLNDYRALVGFEAIAYHLPILLSKYDGSAPEVVAEGENGFIFDPYKHQELAEKIEWILNNQGKLPMMRQRSKQISEAFTSDIAADNLLAAIKASLGKEL